jgi:hypothetical protein
VSERDYLIAKASMRERREANRRDPLFRAATATGLVGSGAGLYGSVKHMGAINEAESTARRGGAKGWSAMKAGLKALPKPYRVAAGAGIGGTLVQAGRSQAINNDLNRRSAVVVKALLPTSMGTVGRAGLKGLKPKTVGQFKPVKAPGMAGTVKPPKPPMSFAPKPPSSFQGA